MKQLFILITLLPGLALSQTSKNVEIDSEISSAIVYLDGAEIHREKDVNISQGKSLLIFKSLSPKLNPKTIQVNVPNHIDILSVTTQINHLSINEENTKVKLMKDSLKLLNDKIIQINDNLDAYRIEKDLLNTNKSLGGTQQGVSIADLKIAADFYRSRILEINGNISKANQQVQSIHSKVNRLNQQLREMNIKSNVSRSEISILINSNQSGSANIDLRYLVSEVGWIPAYDIKATEINQPIQLIYRAKVYNNSDIDWKNISLTLSSADPTLSASKPLLEPWYLNYDNNDKSLLLQNAYQGSGNIRGARSGESQTFIDGIAVKPESDFAEQKGAFTQGSTFQQGSLVFTNIAISDVNAEFKIKDKYSIPSDAKTYFISITEYKLDATFKHYSVPKQNCDVFLLARITGWEKLDILEGTANIYLNGTFTGQSFINTRDVNDTLDLSLGRDNKVQINRNKLSEFTHNKSIGSNKKESFGYEIVIKNNHTVPITIEVVDQIPVAEVSDISVENVELSGGELNELKGLVRWELAINNNETKKLKLSYAIKYPKGRPVNTKRQKFRSVRYL